MNQQEKEQLIKEIFSDEEYVKGLIALETPEEVQASLQEKGLEITVEEINTMKDLLSKMNDGELSDEDLESVSGGCVAVLIGCGAAVAATAVGSIVALLALDARSRRW